MTDFELLRLIGEAEDQYVMESRKRPKKRSRHWPQALAAILVLAVLGCTASYAMHHGMAWGAASATSSDAEAAAVPAEDSALAEMPAELPAEEEAVAADQGITAYDVTLLAQPAYPEAIGPEDYEARSQRWQENQVSQETRTAVNAFAYSTAAAVLRDGEQSGCYSPLSLYQALAILASGAEGQTRDELLSLLGQSDLETLAEESGKLYRVNASENEADVLRIANSLWLDETGPDGSPIAYNQAWVLSAAADYYASVYAAEFDQEDTALALGQWIADNTGGMLHPTPENFDFDENTVMAIVNTLWYETHWADSFQEEKTSDDTFTMENGQTVTAEFMHCTEDSGNWLQGEDYTKASLSLSTGRMIFVLPQEGVDVDSLLTEERLWEIFENGAYESAEIQWSVPKFSTDAQYDLKETLQSLGITAAFDELAADFSPISDTPLFLGKIQQGTHIAVNEEGVEAAAYTLIGMEAAAEMAGGQQVVEMNLNRPFIYLITANDGSTLFMGVVRNPTE